jgi:benzoate-CoA ligase
VQPTSPNRGETPAPERVREPFYNAAVDLLDRNLFAGLRDKAAVIDDSGSYTYAALAERVNRGAGALRGLELQAGQRIALCLLDGIDFHTTFLGAIKAGIVAIPLNTLLTATDYAYILADSGVRGAVVSAERLAIFQAGARRAGWRGQIIVSGESQRGLPELARLLESAPTVAEPAPTQADDACFWLYSSGSTGKPKAAVHRHSSMMRTAELLAQSVLGVCSSDVVYSASKIFFAYGLGNSLSFPLSVGATSVLYRGRATADAINQILREYRPTIFCAVPTLFRSLLASGQAPKAGDHALRFCVSSGEALPAELGRAWRDWTGVDIVEGIGSTEMLHMFIANRPASVRYGTNGLPVPGYKARLVDEDGAEVPFGETGELQVSGPTAAAGYWNQPEKTRATFLGDWTRTGDRFRQNSEGEFVYCGRADDLLKVGGVWVSPTEVESALASHDAVSEVAVVGATDEDGLVKPKAFVVLKPGFAPTDNLARELQQVVKDRLAPYKYPRSIEFVPSLPRTATGKLQRYVLRRSEKQKRSGTKE